MKKLLAAILLGLLEEIKELDKSSIIKDVVFTVVPHVGPCKYETRITWENGEESAVRIDTDDKEKGIAVCFMNYLLEHSKYCERIEDVMERWASTPFQTEEAKNKETKPSAEKEKGKVDIGEERPDPLKATKKAKKAKKPSETDESLIQKKLIENKLDEFKKVGWTENYISQNGVDKIVEKMIKEHLIVKPSKGIPRTIITFFKSEVIFGEKDEKPHAVRYNVKTGAIAVEVNGHFNTLGNKNGVDDLIDICLDRDYKKYFEK